MWCATVRRQHRLPITGPTIGSFTVTPSSTVRDLGVRLHRLGYVDAGPVRDASLLYASCVPSGGRYQLQCSSRLFLLHSSFLDWTIVTAFCLDFLPTSSSASSLFRTLLHGSSSVSDDQSILLPRSSAFTGCASQSASHSNWQS